MGDCVVRVLFVDNDRHFLGELELAFRSAPGAWSIVLAMSVAEATDQLSRGAFNVVVADAGMRGAGGTPFLDIVADRQPVAVRFLLSNQHGLQALGRNDSAHQHLAKPLHAGAVFDRLVQTLKLGQRLSDPSLKSVVSRLKSVPSLPPVFMAIMTELRNEEASARKVGELVAKDGGMAAKILQLVNSPFFGFRMRVAEPSQAVQLLGLETVRGLVLSMHVFEQIDLRTVSRFRLWKVWRHSLATAGFARVIAERQHAGADEVGETFTAALLHDLGKLILAGSLPDDYGVIVEQAEADKTPTWVIERDMIGTTHADVGAYLLGLWGLPPAIVEAVAWHHRPSESDSESLCPLGAVHAANVIEHRLHGADTIAAASEYDEAYLDRHQARSELASWDAACAQADAGVHHRSPA